MITVMDPHWLRSLHQPQNKQVDVKIQRNFNSKTNSKCSSTFKNCKRCPLQFEAIEYNCVAIDQNKSFELHLCS